MAKKIKVQLVKASFWHRLVAYLLDVLPVVILEMTLWVFLETFNFFLQRWLVYFTFCTLSEYAFGTTFGKSIMNLKVITMKRKPPGLLRCFIRNFGKIISGVPYGYGFIIILAPHRRQTIHDKLAGCMVVKRKIIPNEVQKSNA